MLAQVASVGFLHFLAVDPLSATAALHAGDLTHSFDHFH
jgi:hypothetical protein